MKVSISICAKNEQTSIISALNSIVESAKILSNEYSWKVYICLNGSIDQTESIVNSWLQKVKFPTSLIKIKNGNLINAQREIFNLAQKEGCELFMFFDADIIVDINCIPLLVERINSCQEIKVAYATSVPIKRDSITTIEKVLNLYDTSPAIFSQRKHLHGRTFIIREWYIPISEPELIVDDIYLSFYLLKNYGTKSISKVDEAIIYFRQIKTFSDYYRVFRRRSIELKKCKILFPELCQLPKEQINRQIIWSKFFKETFQRQKIWLILFLIKKIASVKFKFEFFYTPSNFSQWETPLSTKRTRSLPLLVLIEGLDCSGKKTLAKSVYNKLNENGISCIINIGPLGPKWYKSLIRIISLNPFPNFIRSFFYTVEVFISSKTIKDCTSDVILQISSPYRNTAYSLAKESYIRSKILKIGLKRTAYYNLLFYLTASYSERVKRHKNQFAAGENSDNIDKRFIGEQFFLSMESELINLLKSKYYIEKIIDTEKTSIEDNTNHLVKDIISNI